MPAAIAIPAIIGGASTVVNAIGAHNASNASKNAAATQVAASDKASAIQQQATQQALQYLQQARAQVPQYQPTGASGTLQKLMGLSTPAGTGPAMAVPGNLPLEKTPGDGYSAAGGAYSGSLNGANWGNGLMGGLQTAIARQNGAAAPVAPVRQPMITVRAPNGQTAQRPASERDHWVSKGAQVIG